MLLLKKLSRIVKIIDKTIINEHFIKKRDAKKKLARKMMSGQINVLSS